MAASRMLVSGVDSLVAEVAAAARADGASVTEVVDLTAVPEVCAAAGTRAFDSYVQLPASFQLAGETTIERVHHFYANGVLARFTALAAALPSLAPDARLTFVLGRLPADVATSDDRAARRSLTRVLAGAARADMPDGHLDIRMLDAGCPAADIARIALGRQPAQPDLVDRLPELSYTEWRIEMMGLISAET
jgi:hypothetical protein